MTTLTPFNTMGIGVLNLLESFVGFCAFFTKMVHASVSAARVRAWMFAAFAFKMTSVNSKSITDNSAVCSVEVMVVATCVCILRSVSCPTFVYGQAVYALVRSVSQSRRFPN